MKSNGFIPLSIVACHGKQTLDLEVLRSVCKEHQSVLYVEELKGVGSIKCKIEWKGTRVKWLPPAEENCA